MMGLINLVEESPKTGPETLVSDVVDLMAEANVGAIAILEDERVVGIFTERDLVRRVVASGLDATATPVREVMSKPVHTVTNETSLRDATRLMRQHHMRYLPVLDASGKYAGILALRHLHNEIMRGLERRVHDLTTWLMADAPGG